MNSLADIIASTPKGAAGNAARIIKLRNEYNAWISQGGDPSVSFEQFAAERGINVNPYRSGT